MVDLPSALPAPDVSVRASTAHRCQKTELTQPCYRTVRARADAGEDRAAGVGTITLVCPYGARDRTCAARCARVGETGENVKIMCTPSVGPYAWRWCVLSRVLRSGADLGFEVYAVQVLTIVQIVTAALSVTVALRRNS